MAFATKGWRRIVVEGRVFYWRAEFECGFEKSPVRWNILQARPAIEPYRHLIVSSCECGNRSSGYTGVVSPRIARGCIESAIKFGWQTERPILRQVLLSRQRHIVLSSSWLTSTVITLVNSIYADNVFSWMPILADALQDAGCDNEDILNHCRSEGQHVRGCWVVDLILGKA